jgi:hypothetical protein
MPAPGILQKRCRQKGLNVDFSEQDVQSFKKTTEIHKLADELEDKLRGSIHSDAAAGIEKTLPQIGRINHRRADPTKPAHSGAPIPISLQFCGRGGNDLSSSSITIRAINISQISTSHLRRLLHLCAGIRNALGILSSNVARIALFALASCTRWPSVVCLAVLTQAGMCETS